MKYPVRSSLLLLVASLIVAMPAWGAKAAKGTMVGLTQGLLLEEITLGDPTLLTGTAREFQVGPHGVPLFSAENEIRLLVGKKRKYESSSAISSFSFSPKGALFVVSGRELGTLKNGKFVGIINLPFDKMRILSKNEVSLYLYGNDPQNHGQVFVLNSDGTFSKQIQTTAPLQGLKLVSDGLLVLTDTSIYRYRDGGAPVPLLTLIKGKFESAEIGPGLRPEDAPFFVSTDDGVFLSKQGRLVPLLGNVHCQVAGYLSSEGSLSTYALCPGRKKLFKLTVELAKIPAEFHPAKETSVKTSKSNKWKN